MWQVSHFAAWTAPIAEPVLAIEWIPAYLCTSGARPIPALRGRAGPTWATGGNGIRMHSIQHNTHCSCLGSKELDRGIVQLKFSQENLHRGIGKP